MHKKLPRKILTVFILFSFKRNFIGKKFIEILNKLKCNLIVQSDKT